MNDCLLYSAIPSPFNDLPSRSRMPFERSWKPSARIKLAVVFASPMSERCWPITAMNRWSHSVAKLRGIQSTPICRLGKPGSGAGLARARAAKENAEVKMDAFILSNRMAGASDWYKRRTGGED